MAKITRIKATDPHQAKPKPEKLEKPKKPEKVAQPKPAKQPKQPKKPMGKFRRVITAPFRYIHSSWLELRQVRWPSRKSTWAMVLAVLVYTAIFIGFIVLIDALFTLIFNNVLGQ